jgi:Predicted phosphoribosyltransferases
VREKIYLDANSLLSDSFLLARQILDSGFTPECIIALWRGGTPVGIAVQEFLHYKGNKCWHTAVRTASYTGIAERGKVSIENLDPILDRITPDTKVLVVDDIFDTGRTALAIKNELASRTNHAKIATLYYKPSSNEVGFKPDFYVKATDSWLVFPHEFIGLHPEEIKEKSPQLHALLGLDKGIA